MHVAIINYGLGNLGSIKNMLSHIDIESVITSDASVITGADGLILPGVGHFDHGMRHLTDSGLIDVLNDEVMKKKKPILGICLGAQLLMDASEEGDEKGLGWIKGSVRRFENRQDSKGKLLKVPHMGWSAIEPRNTTLFDHMDDDRRFYFVHSYHLCPDKESDVLSCSDYGGEFVSGIQKENIIGVQFHPEKSHQYGMQFLRNYFAKSEGH